MKERKAYFEGVVSGLNIAVALGVVNMTSWDWNNRRVPGARKARGLQTAASRNQDWRHYTIA